ncbi:MAG: hypothetical protein NC181_02255 [Clostridium sp.]|nr:hypothetical protein [Clostridium sp.]MCM1443707.1 hypothetical protein [Candidatus Amulumruptor caecigallinarius]
MYGKVKGLTSYEVATLNDLNVCEAILLDSLCLNLIDFDYNRITLNLNFILENKENFIKNIIYYKDTIIKLFKFYIPVYSLMSNLKSMNSPFEIPSDKNYVKIYPITDIIKNDIMRQINTVNTTCNYTLNKSDIYYMIYQFIINISYGKEYNLYINKILLMLKQDNLNMDYDTYKVLLDICKFGLEYFPLEEQIVYIKELKQNNLHPILNLYASLDIAKYNILEEKKKVFGLK